MSDSDLMAKDSVTKGPTSMTVVAKDLHRLIRRAGKITADQAFVCDPDWDKPINRFKVDITPNSGYYEGRTYRFEIRLPKDYASDDPPIVECETDIYHPNISSRTQSTAVPPGHVCMNILNEGTWKQKYGLETIVKGLVYLLKNPNFDDPLVTDFGDLDVEELEANFEAFGVD